MENWKDKLEREVPSIYEHALPSDHEASAIVLISIALSLKRIADALERPTHRLVP